MQRLLALLLACTLSTLASADAYPPAGACANGQCPLATAPPAAQTTPGLRVNPQAIARITNTQGSARSAGSGTLIDADGKRALVITCAHLFREGAGTLSVTFPDQQTFDAELLKIDAAADLAVLGIPDPGLKPIALAQTFPQRGDPLVSCGYGSDGRLWCNRGQALGYVTTVGSHGVETLELTGAARFGDSGGPVLDRNHQLVAVLFGTNGRVVDGTFCGRVRRFLADLSPRFGKNPPAVSRTPPPAQRPIDPSPPVSPPNPPLVQAPPAGSPVESERLANLEQLISRLNSAWPALSAKLDALASAVEGAQAAANSGGDSASGSSPSSPDRPPQIELPPGLDAIGGAAGSIGAAAEPWISARLAALLISLGVPGGAAGIVAAAVVWWVMRRGRKRLQDQLDRLQTHGASSPAAEADPPMVERHHNRYVAYEVTALDKAWAAAHAHVGEKFPGAVPYLKIAEGVKDQLLSGNHDAPVS